MTTKATVKLIKRKERLQRKSKATEQLTVGPNRWSKSVRLWVREFENRDQSEPIPGFESLFKDAESEERGNADLSASQD
jgi:hypothetical protein